MCTYKGETVAFEKAPQNFCTIATPYKYGAPIIYNFNELLKVIIFSS